MRAAFLSCETAQLISHHMEGRGVNGLEDLLLSSGLSCDLFTEYLLLQ